MCDVMSMCSVKTLTRRLPRAADLFNIPEFVKQLHTSAPHLAKLQLKSPAKMDIGWIWSKSLSQNCDLHGRRTDWYGSARAKSVMASIRDLSYRLEDLRLETIGDILPVFQGFLRKSYDASSTTLPRWPMLRRLGLRSRIILDENTCDTDRHSGLIMLAFARAIRFMPKLTRADLYLEYEEFVMDDLGSNEDEDDDDEDEEEGNRQLCKYGRTYLLLQQAGTALERYREPDQTAEYELTINCGSYVPSAEILETFKESVAHGLRATLKVVVKDTPYLCLHETFPGHS